MMECAHCGQACEARAMARCEDCGAMACENCLGAGACPDGPALETDQSIN